MPFHVRFYVYDDVERKKSHHLLTDRQTNSLVGLSAGRTILLIEEVEGSLARTYVIAQEPTLRRHPRGTTEPVVYVDVFVVKEENQQGITHYFPQIVNPWYGPSL